MAASSSPPQNPYHTDRIPIDIYTYNRDPPVRRRQVGDGRGHAHHAGAGAVRLADVPGACWSVWSWGLVASVPCDKVRWLTAGDNNKLEPTVHPPKIPKRLGHPAGPVQLLLLRRALLPRALLHGHAPLPGGLQSHLQIHLGQVGASIFVRCQSMCVRTHMLMCGPCTTRTRATSAIDPTTPPYEDAHPPPHPQQNPLKKPKQFVFATYWQSSAPIRFNPPLTPPANPPIDRPPTHPTQHAHTPI